MFFPRALYSHVAVAGLNCPPTKSEYKAMRLLDFTCQCCGFKAVPSKAVQSAGLEFLSVNGELKLLCIMCAQSQVLSRPILLENGKKEFNHGRLVYCPEVPQGKIISVVRDIYALSLYQKSNPNRVLRSYIEELRESYVEQLVGRCANVPSLKISSNDLVGFASLYKYAPPELLDSENNVFGSIRYIPDELVFSHVTNYWFSTSYKSILTGF